MAEPGSIASPVDVPSGQLSPGARLILRLLPVALAAAAYLGRPMLMGREGPRPQRFVALADAFWHERLTIVDPRPNELIPSDAAGAFYCPYPPLPAVVLMPLVALFGAAVKVQTATRVVSVLAVAIFDSCLGRWPALLGRKPLAPGTRSALACLFAVGTVVWHCADAGGDWHFAHALALTAMLLAMREFAGRNRPLVVGLFVALAAGARPTAAMTGVFFVIADATRTRPTRGGGAGARLLPLALGPIAAALLLGWYNAARFGSWTDFGYDRMILDEHGSELLHQYGQFNVRFIPVNFFWYLLAPPWPPFRPGLGPLAFNPHGMSLFLTTPACLYALAALRRIRTDRLVLAATLGILAALVPLLMYFNTGYFQFGHRFAMDYLPLLMLLIVMGMGERPSRWACGLIALSIAVHVWGVCFATAAARLPTWMTPTI